MHFTGKTGRVWNVLSEQDSFVSAMEIYRALCTRGERIGLITVYRALHASRRSNAFGKPDCHRARTRPEVGHGATDRQRERRPAARS